MAKKTTKIKGVQVDVAGLREIANQIVIFGAEDDLDSLAVHDIVAVAEDWLRLHPEPKERPELTTRQADIFNYFLEQFNTDGTIPTVREIGSHFGIRSPNGVMCHLKALVKKGLLYQLPGSTARNWRICREYMARV